jgi:hypothetical protein
METLKERVLTKLDRCDKCGAEGYVLVKLMSGSLVFCGHHFIENQEKLLKISYDIIDEREHLQ